MHWFKVVLPVSENTKTDDIHKPSHSRECSQWKHDLGKKNIAICSSGRCCTYPIAYAFKLHWVQLVQWLTGRTIRPILHVCYNISYCFLWYRRKSHLAEILYLVFALIIFHSFKSKISFSWIATALNSNTRFRTVILTLKTQNYRVMNWNIIRK